MAAGEPFGITPYGTEAMHVLRAEKGFPIIGQDTDGTVTPHDLGMSWIVTRKDDSDFVGRRSLRRVRHDATGPQAARRPAARRSAARCSPRARSWSLEDTGRIPMPMVGHVTSSYRSATSDRTFALAMVGGRPSDRTVETVYAAAPRGDDRRDRHRAGLLRPGGGAP